MNVILDTKHFNTNNIFFQKPITNTVIDKSIFIRILYSNELIILNGIYIKVNLKITNIQTYYNRYKYNFNIAENQNIIDHIQYLENSILRHYKCNKTKKFKITEQVNNCNIKIYTDRYVNNNPSNFALKISGIWESEHEYGITYKFIIINHLYEKTLI